MKKYLVLASVVSLVLMAGSVNAGWYSKNFEDTGDPLTEWSNIRTDETPGTPSHLTDRFLGQFVNESTILTADNLPTHDTLNISFDLYVIRTWDGNASGVGGEEWDLSIWDTDSGQWQVLQQNGKDLHTGFSNMSTDQAYPDSYSSGNYSPRTGAAEINTLGFRYANPPTNPITDAVYRIQVDSISHTEDSVQLKFSASGLQAVINPGNNAWDESWGLDNVAVTPEPATMGLLTLGGLAVLRRRRMGNGVR